MTKYLSKEGLQTLVQQIDNKYASKATVPSAYQPKITAGTGLAFAGNTLNITLDTTLYQVVESLPEEGQNPNKIYLMLGEAGEQNTYTEYLWVNSKWEKLGEYKAAIDLTPYLKKTEAEETYAKKSHTHTFSQITDNVPVSKLPIATSTTVGAVKGGTTTGKSYGVTVGADGAMTVNVPWTDTLKSLADGEGSGSTVGSVGTKINMWEYYWREVWEESEPSGLYHVNQVGVSGVKSEMQSAGFPIEPPDTVTNAETLVEWMKTQELYAVDYDASRAKGYAGAVFGVKTNSEAPSTYVEGGLNTVGKNFFRFHVEGMRHNLSESDYQIAGHVEGQLHQMKGYGTVNHIEGSGNMYAGLNPSAKEGGSYRQGDAPVAVHVEGLMNLAAGEYSHIEGVGNIGLGKRDHIEGSGNTSKASEVYAAYPNYGATLWQSLEDDWRSITPTHRVYRFQASVGLNTSNHVEGGQNFVYGLTWSNASVALEHGVPAELSSCYYFAHIHAEGVLNYAKGTVLHVEGIFNEATGIAGHVEGFYNKVQNAGEHASGYWNASHKASETKGDAGNTLYSIGCGTSEDDRKNALEVMQDGTIYMLDTSSGKTMNVQNLLKSAEKAITLKPGQGLRIGTDGNIEIDVESLKQLLGLA